VHAVSMIAHGHDAPTIAPIDGIGDRLSRDLAGTLGRTRAFARSRHDRTALTCCQKWASVNKGSFL